MTDWSDEEYNKLLGLLPEGRKPSSFQTGQQPSVTNPFDKKKDLKNMADGYNLADVLNGDWHA
jgi:hypothetical protein